MNSHPDGPERADRASALPSGWTVSGDASNESAPERQSSPPVPVPPRLPPARPGESAAQRNDITNLQLVLFGVFGGLYLLYTVGWFLIAQYFAAANSLAASTSGIIGGVFQQALFWSSAAAPALWFVASIVLARGKKPWFLPVALVLGMLVLLPLPLFVVGEAG